MCDARKAAFPSQAFEKIVIYAGIQYFSEGEIVQLFRRFYDWLSPGGKVFVGDIPDREKIWVFHNSPEREAAYFESLLQDKPIIGTWLDRKFLLNLARYAEFSKAEIVPQNDIMIYSDFRYDLLLVK